MSDSSKNLVPLTPLILHVFVIESNIPWSELMVVSRPLLKITTRCDRIHGTVPTILNLAPRAQLEYCVKGTNSHSARIAITPILHHSISMIPNRETIKQL